MNKNIKSIFTALENHYPTSTIALNFSTPMELLVTTVLSAQSTDALINKITPALFERCKTVKDYAEIPVEDLEKLIFSSGFYHNKAANIKNAAQVIIDEFGGVVPNNMEDLLKLPGVARKTANIVLYHAFGIEEGIAVDTHVKRISRLIGLTESNDPNKIEKDLMAIIPRQLWGKTNTLLISLGRDICIANRPRCSECPIKKYCRHGAKA